MSNFEKETSTAIYFLKGPFSNFYKTKFTFDEHSFSNSEQAFMYCKAKHFNDITNLNAILKTTNPAEAKGFGRSVKNFNVSEWSNVSYDYMLKVNIAKFEQNNSLKQLLLSTINKEIVECNPKDYIWSCGYYALDPKALNKDTWKGKNWLGEVLMEVRKHLKGE